VIGLTCGLPHHRTFCERLAFSVRYVLWPKSFLFPGGGGGCLLWGGGGAEEKVEYWPTPLNN